MIKPRDPRELAEDLIYRSTCAVQVAAVISDDHGIFSWGWNGVGLGFGEHAEAHAIRRSNRKRLKNSTIYVASVRKRNNKVINSKPCEECAKRIMGAGIGAVCYRDERGVWVEYDLVQ